MSFQKRTEESERISSSKSVLLALSGGETQFLDFEEFANKFKSDSEFTENGDASLFTCYLMEGSAEANRARGITHVPTHILKAMQSVGSIVREGGDTEVDEPTDVSCGTSLLTIGGTIFVAVRGVIKAASRIYKVSELLSGAFGPTRTRQKVERCLSELGCLLIMYSLFLALALGTNAKFTPSLTLKSVSFHTVSLVLLFGYGVWMVSYANGMASNDYSEKKGRDLIIGALAPFLFSIAALAFV